MTDSLWDEFLEEYGTRLSPHSPLRNRYYVLMFLWANDRL